MIPILLTKIKTSDGIILDGIYVPPKPKSVSSSLPRGGLGKGQRRDSKTALIWVHGLSSRFYSGQTLIKELSGRCANHRIGYLKFNTRGHDIVVRGAKKPLGSAFEKFEDSKYDLRAMIRYARKLGYQNIILAGHSTGAQKSVYYLWRTKDKAVKGLILAGPVSDLTAGELKFGKRGLRKGIFVAQKILKKNRRGLMPHKYGILTAARFLSLFKPGSAEDIFPYHNPKAKWKELKSIRAPIAVIFGSREEYADRPVKNLIEIFRKNAESTKSFSGVIIKGAKHSFRGKEKEVSHSIIKWIKEIEADRRGYKRG